MNNISEQKRDYKDEILDDWFEDWKPYVAAHRHSKEIVGEGITHAKACFFEDAKGDDNRGGAPRLDFVFVREDGSYCRVHPGNQRRQDAKLIVVYPNAREVD